GVPATHGTSRRRRARASGLPACSPPQWQAREEALAPYHCTRNSLARRNGIVTGAPGCVGGVRGAERRVRHGMLVAENALALSHASHFLAPPLRRAPAAFRPGRDSWKCVEPRSGSMGKEAGRGSTHFRRHFGKLWE